MTDPEPTPAQERAVRDRLAAARHTAPVPADVVARLDATLRRLAAEDAEPPATAPVVTLAPRRRRTAAALLVAAAVVVGGVGIGQVLPTGGHDAATTSDAGADRAFSGGAPAAEQDSGTPGLSGSRRTTGPESASPDAAAAPPVAALSASRLRRDLLAVVDRPDAPFGAPTDCDAGDVGDGRLLPVTYDGQEAVVVLRTPRAGFRQADVYLCGNDSPVRSLELPAR